MRDPAIVIQARVISALILRDVKTRFGANPFNYLVAIAWPIAHLALLLIIYTATGRQAPYGSNPLQFFGTGVLPYILFNYPARFVMLSVTMNAPLLGFPIVTLFDVIIARVLLEIISAFAVVIVIASTLFALGVDIVPRDSVSALAALGATLTLATGIGILNALIVKKVPGWSIAFILFTILLYLLSGVVFVPDALPEEYRTALAWNPLLQAVSWFRSSYYEGYGQLHLDRQYLVVFAILSVLVGLAFERLARRWLLSS